MVAPGENDDLSYASEVGFGRYAAVLLSVLLTMGCVLEIGAYHPTRLDRLWALVSRKPMPEHSAPLDDTTVISLTRTMCFGECPDYVVRIFGSGRVEYLGNNFVCTFGAQTATADPREVRRLVEAMIGTGFFGYGWARGSYATDNPTVTSVLTHGGQSYALSHYHGDDGAPHWLYAMENEIDRVAGTARWLPRYGERTGWHSLCTTHDGGTRDVTMHPTMEDQLSRIIRPTIEASRIESSSPGSLLTDL
jgi:hypothetical protein